MPDAHPHRRSWVVWLVFGCTAAHECENVLPLFFLQVNPLRRGVVLCLSLSLPSLRTRLHSVPHSERNIITCSLAPLVLSCFPCCCQSEGRLSLSLPSLCIFSHLLLFEMSSWGEMGEAIELRWVRYSVGDVVQPREGADWWYSAYMCVFALQGICEYVSHYFSCICV